MEKFAVDLDKVLDDFELDEDENVGPSQFGRLQLDYSSSTSNDSSATSSSVGLASQATAASAAMIPSGLASMGGWSEPQQSRRPPHHKQPFPAGEEEQKDGYPRKDSSLYSLSLDLPPSDAVEDVVVPGVRSPPDGQNDDHSNAVAHHSQYGGGNTSVGAGFQSYPAKVTPQVLPYSHGATIQTLSIQPANQSASTINSHTMPNETLWPRFSANNIGSNIDSLSTGSQQPLSSQAASSQHSVEGHMNSSNGANVRREAIGASPTDDSPSIAQEDDSHPGIPSVPQDVSVNNAADADIQAIREVAGAVLDLGDQDNNISREMPGAILDLGDQYILASREVPGAALDLGDQDGGSVAGPREAAGAVLDLGDQDSGVSSSREGQGGAAVLDLVSSRPVDVIASTVNTSAGGGATARPLDIVTGACQLAMSTDRLEAGAATRHPDVIDVPQSAEDSDSSPAGGPGDGGAEGQAMEVDMPGERDLEENPPDVNDQRLLPDLMANNNEELPLPEGCNDFQEPAIVMENALTCHTNNEPALVQESQTCNRIPEVVNVHQTCEAGGLSNGEGNVAHPVCDIAMDSASGSDLTASGAHTRQLDGSSNGAVDLVNPSECAGGAVDLDERSCDRSVADESAQPTEPPSVVPPVPLAFNPNEPIADLDLEAELAELEEEQAILQGAYAVDQDRVTPPLNPQEKLQQPEAQQPDSSSSQTQAISSIVCNNGSISDPATTADHPAAALGLDIIGQTSTVLLDNTSSNDLKDTESDLVCVSRESTTVVSSISPAVDSSGSNRNEGGGAATASSDNEKSPRRQLTTQMSEDFASDQNCGRVDSVPRISAEVCAVPATNSLDRITATAAAAANDACSDGGADAAPGDVHINENGASEQETAAAGAEGYNDEGALASPARRLPGSLVTAIYDDSQAVRSRSDDSSASGGGTLNMVGSVAPFWVPDDDAANCQECGNKFTLVRRRHHCRACGRVLCAQCCKDKAPLAYMHYREARVCHTCRLMITIAEDEETSEGLSRESSGHGEAAGATGGPSQSSSPRSPDPNNPMEFCSRIPPAQQAAGSGFTPTPTVMVPVGVLKREDSCSGGGAGSRSGRHGCGKQVIFSDGIRPGGDLTELDRHQPPGGGSSTHQPPPPPHRARAGRVAKIMPGTGTKRAGVRGDVCLLPPGGGLPPVLRDRGRGCQPEYLCSEGSNEEQQQRLAEQMAGDGPPVLFAINSNLTVVVKLVKLECCVGVRVWSVGTRGLCGVGQEELVLLLEALPGETHPPSDVFAYFYSVYQQANKGNLVSELGHTILTEPEGFLGSRDHGGFLYVRPTFQCLHNLPLPQPPFLFALLIHKWETPWAKVFPLRLLLRLGAEFRYYPCPLVSTRNRKPVFSEIGHTIMTLLVDFRNYTYTIPGVQGLVVHMEDKKTTLYLPRNRYAQVSKALGNSNDHVLALAANFSPQADSHLVTIENDDGQYSTQAINIHNRPRKVTGASFVVFNGALKSNCGLTAKSSIVEDGLMVQITSDVMTALREALRAMKDFSIACGITGEPPQEEVILRWGPDDNNFNVGVKSPVDGMALDGVQSVKIHSGTDYVSSDFLIRWTEVFIIQGESASNGAGDVNLSRIWEGLARGFCVALTPHLPQLHAALHTHLALRATIHHQDVGYEAGSGGSRLSPACLNSLDSELVPVIHRAAASVTHDPVILELFFHVLQQ